MSNFVESETAGAGARRVLGLFSGGLDSLLAIRLLLDRGVRVEGLHLRTGYSPRSVETELQARWRALAPTPSLARLAGPLVVADVAGRYTREVVGQPRFGVGAAMNPCLDCRTFMLREADARAGRLGIRWLVTGDVVGQRTLEQQRGALARIDEAAGVTGRVLRPLTAALLPEPVAGLAGLVDIAGLPRIHGRSRRSQLALAERLGIESSPAPSGSCCRLAEMTFGRRLRDHLSHLRRGVDPSDGVELLHLGRHFRLSWKLKAVLGRDDAENRLLESLAGGRLTCRVSGGRGSLVLVQGEPEPAETRGLAGLAARYSRDREQERVEVVFCRRAEEFRQTVEPATGEQLAAWRI